VEASRAQTRPFRRRSAPTRDRPDRDERGHAMACSPAGGAIMPTGVLINHHASARAAGQPASRLRTRGGPRGVRPVGVSAARGRVGLAACHTLSERVRDTCTHVCPVGPLPPAGVGCDRSSWRAGHRARRRN
jgi:hypothetical protein